MNALLTWSMAGCGVLIVFVLGSDPGYRGPKVKQQPPPASTATVQPDQRPGVVNPFFYHPDMPRLAFDDKWLLGADVTAGGPKKRNFKLYELNTGKVLKTFEGHTEDILSIKMSLDRKYVVTGAGQLYIPGQPPKDATARLWNLANGKEVMRFGRLESRVGRVYLSPNNQRLLTIGAEDTRA